jgi:hypothetical protein
MSRKQKNQETGQGGLEKSKRSEPERSKRGSSETDGFHQFLKTLAERLPYSKLTAAQAANVVFDVLGAMMAITFVFKSDNDIHKLLCIFGVLVLSLVCLQSSDRRRRF